MMESIFLFHFTWTWTGPIFPLSVSFSISDDIFYRTPMCLYIFPPSNELMDHILLFFFFCCKGENRNVLRVMIAASLFISTTYP